MQTSVRTGKASVTTAELIRLRASDALIRPRLLFTALFWMLSSATAGVSLVIATTNTSSQLVLSVLSMLFFGLGSVIFSLRRLSGAMRLVQLFPLWIVYYVITFGLASLEWRKQQTGSAGVVNQSTVPNAVLLAEAALVAVSAGYFIGRSGPMRRVIRGFVKWGAVPSSSALRFPSIGPMLYFVGILASAVQLHNGAYGYLGNAANSLANPSSFNQLLSILGQLADIGLMVSVLDALLITRSFRAKFWATGIFVFQIGFAAISGVKGNLLTTVIAVAVAYAAARRKVPVRAAVGVIVVVWLFIPVNQQYRNAINVTAAHGRSPVQTVGALPGLIRQTYGGTTDAWALQRHTFNYLMQRNREIDNVALIMQDTPSRFQYQSPLNLVSGPVVGLIPRALWPTKPILSQGYAFSQEYYGIGGGSYTASAVTLPGDAYRYGGPWVVIVTMLLLGLLLRAIEEEAGPWRDMRNIIVYAGLFILATNMESDLVTFAITCVEDLVFLALVTRVVFVGRRVGVPGE